ncbi:MAG: Wzz/FepE/Etk N-terminal domain-containing protein, partial [Ignavibacteriaceae bacterium]|nr:Wzz/FepE/Etk N-terminal domain-containing protein [Ignavibacteriaceae bacterium]
MTLHDIIHVLLINWKTILKLTFGVSLVVFIYLLLISPVTYDAQVTILPPTEKDQISGLGSLLSGGEVTDFLTGKFAPGNSQLFVEIL